MRQAVAAGRRRRITARVLHQGRELDVQVRGEPVRRLQLLQQHLRRRAAQAVVRDLRRGMQYSSALLNEDGVGKRTAGRFASRQGCSIADWAAPAAGCAHNCRTFREQFMPNLKA